MIRPEASAMLLRWREALVGAGAVALGLWLLARGGGLPWLFGLVLVLIGAVLLPSGWRRARLRTEAEAPGIVSAVEGTIAYMGPITGGMVSLDELSEVAFRRASTGEGFWRLAAVDGAPLTIPEGARGAEVLLDALAPLPGFDGGAMVRAVRGRTGTTVVWRRSRPLALPRG
ncbi:hypothetical protein JQC91_01695 [Jannaschia sp. Os4]|uniref:hypothetical protein n=1 Tax=Jannaschia sp. Os4 TaxID=2807617 RepID=UPI001939A1F7|nr:hypothetical protein [Jannaschia sp. Os4]MBM2575005.1 hypothetical protein [Jannaschia sp. Os4]